MKIPYLGLLDADLKSDAEEDADVGRRSDDDDDERTSRAPAPTVVVSLDRRNVIENRERIENACRKQWMYKFN